MLIIKEHIDQIINETVTNDSKIALDWYKQKLFNYLGKDFILEPEGKELLDIIMNKMFLHGYACGYCDGNNNKEN